MKKSLPRIVILLAAAGLGWLAGAFLITPGERARSDSAPAQSGAEAGFGQKARAGPARDPAQRMAAELAIVRAVPGASSETAWVQWAMGIADADIPAVVARLNPLTDLHALRYLYARWTKLEPQAAWASFCQSKIPKSSNHFYLPTENSGPGSGLNSSSLSESPRSLIAVRMLVSWKELDPAGAKALFAKLQDPKSPEATALGVSTASLGNVMENTTPEVAWTSDECAGKAAEAQALPESIHRTQTLFALMRQWQRADLRAALEWSKQLPEFDRKALEIIRAEAAVTSLPFEERAAFLRSDIEAMGAPQNTGDFDPQDNTEDGPYARLRPSGQEAESMIRDWAAQNPAAMMLWLNSLPEGKAKSNLTATAAVALVGKDQQAAVSLLNSMEGDQQQALRTFMSGWAASDAAASLAWAEKIPDATTRDNCLATAAASLAGSDPELALKSAQGITDEDLRRRIFDNVENQLSWNPAALADLRRRFPGEMPAASTTGE